jgi:hypothetical protein
MAIKLNLKKILIDACDIYRNNPVRDETGHEVDTGTVQIAANLKCRLLPVKSRKTQPGNPDESKVAVSRFTLYLMPPTFASGDVLDEHKVVRVTVFGSLTPADYYIIEVLPPVLVGAPVELTLELVKS